MSNNPFNTLQEFRTGGGDAGQFYSLPKLEEAGVGPVSRLPVSIRIVLESVLRNCDGRVVEEEDVRALAARNIGPSEIARRLNIGRTSVHRILNGGGT